MKFSCDKSLLLDGINTVQRAVATKDIVPILKGILLTTEDGHLHLAATDLEICIQTKRMIIDCEEEGSAVIPAKLFSEIVRKLPDELITCETKNNKFVIKYRGSQMELTTMDPLEFPAMPEADNEIATLPTEILKNGIKRTIIAVATDGSRPVFTGLLFTLSNGNLDIVGTDTHRLAVFSQPVDTQNDFMAIIPAKGAAEVLRLIPEGDIKIKGTENLLSFEWGETRIITRTIEGQFPRYQQVIPKKCTSRVYLSVTEFKGVIERANILAEGENKVIKISGTTEQFNVSSMESQTGKLDEHMDVDFEGDEITVAVNSKFILNALSVLESKDIYVEFSGAMNPISISEEGYTHIVLPVRTS